MKIPTGSFNGDLDVDKFRINGEEKASIDREDKYHRIMKGHLYYTPDKCLLNKDKEMEKCQVTKKGTQYQVDSTDRCQLLKIYRNENVHLKIKEGRTRFQISYWKGNKLNRLYQFSASPHTLLSFDWSNEVVAVNRFRMKSIPKDTDYFIILIHSKIAFTQIPSREEITSQGRRMCITFN